MIDQEHVAELVYNVWATMLNQDPVSVEAESVQVPAPLVTACLNITGDWEGAVLIQCAKTYAGELAASMFEMGADEVSLEEVSDAMGELVNMVGGNFKSLLPGTCQISLPTVTEGSGYTISIKGATQRRAFGFDSAGEPFIVHVHSKA